ncbi:MAG: hypothetical protein LBH97_01770 [Treponema sp.]|nr:hypothetical protein [Treponema sp.]
MKISIFSLFLAALCGGCQPYGALVGVEADSMWVAPIRSLYIVMKDSWFEKDLTVYAAHKGYVTQVPLDRCDVVIKRDVAFGEDQIVPWDGFPEFETIRFTEIFEYSGTYIVDITYQHMTTYYKFEVIDPEGIGKQDGPGGSGQGGGIIIEWAKPPPPELPPEEEEP